MTGYTVHTGSTVKFSNGWDEIFGGASSKKSDSGRVKSSKPASSNVIAAKKRSPKKRAKKTR